MATTVGDLVPSGGRPPMKRQTTLSEALAEMERLEAALEHERGRVHALDEQLREARRLEGIGRLASGVAHDFSNILAVISGYSDLMLNRMAPTDPLRRGAESIRKAAVWGLNLTQHMLTTSRTAAPVATSLDVNAVVTGVVHTLAPLLGEHVQVVLELEPRVGRVRVNMGQLEQTLMNLLLNARDAMPSGGRVTVHTANVSLEPPSPGPRCAVMVRITDTGAGMDSATLARAFEPYFTTKPPGRGTGLGLATVFAFVSQSAGHVEATSEVGRGSVFTIYLPRDLAADAAPLMSATGATVLVVEPEAGVRDLIAEILDLHGYLVLAARDLDEALAVSDAHQGPIAIVVADSRTPGVAGDGVLERLGPARAAARVLYLSDDVGPDDPLRGLPPGRAVLPKPFTVDALVQKVGSLLGR